MSSKPYGDVKYADPGYQSDGKARYPLDSEEHCRAAWSYINQAGNAAKYTPDQLKQIKSRIRSALDKYGVNVSDDRSARLAVCTRSYDFEIRSISHDGRRLVGTVAVFNTRTRIPDRNGDFDEVILPGFMDRSLREHGVPVMQFDHGKDPRTGTVPIGKYDVFDRRSNGYDVEGDLFDNAVVEPIRQAIQAGAVKGMSFRMKVSKGGDRWDRRSNDVDLRQVADADVPEAGPVVFPAYRDTKVAVRSLLATFDDEERLELIRELRAEAGLPTDFTGVPSTRSGGRGEPDAQPWEGEASTQHAGRARALALGSRPVITLP